MGRRDHVLTLAEMLEVRVMRAAGRPPRDIARIFGVSVRTVYRSCEGTVETATVGGQPIVLQIVPGQAPRWIKRPAIEASA